jgi:diguanylate cyclase
MQDLNAPDVDASGSDLRFAQRMWWMRSLGLGLCMLPIAVVLHEQGASPAKWIALLANGFLWSHVAYLHSRRSRDPRAAEHRNLMIDSAMGGAWIAVMEFNLVPSALIAAMQSVDKIAVGGWRFLARTAVLQVATCLAVSALLGFPVALESSMAVVVASLPFLFTYSTAISAASYRLARRVVQQNRQLERLNRIDLVTGLPNRRHWNEVVTAELARFLRTRRPAVLLLIDVDNFKEVNDRHGHATGDDVLRCIAGVLRASIREIDMPARYGGDEFGVLLTETDARGGRDVAERIRTTFLAMRGAEAAAENCTLSIGLAEADRELITVDDWVRRADAAMYQAKAGGRNRVEQYRVPVAR